MSNLFDALREIIKRGDESALFLLEAGQKYFFESKEIFFYGSKNDAGNSGKEVSIAVLGEDEKFSFWKNLEESLKDFPPSKLPPLKCQYVALLRYPTKEKMLIEELILRQRVGNAFYFERTKKIGFFVPKD